MNTKRCVDWEEYFNKGILKINPIVYAMKDAATNRYLTGWKEFLVDFDDYRMFNTRSENYKNLLCKVKRND